MATQGMNDSWARVVNQIETIWSVGDIFNAILITVNVISIFFLIHKVSRVMK